MTSTHSLHSIRGNARRTDSTSNCMWASSIWKTMDFELSSDKRCGFISSRKTCRQKLFEMMSRKQFELVPTNEPKMQKIPSRKKNE